MEKTFARTCQECSHKQRAKDPNRVITNAYANAKCRRCGSMGLDYGTLHGVNANGRLIQLSGPAEPQEA